MTAPKKDDELEEAHQEGLEEADKLAKVLDEEGVNPYNDPNQWEGLSARQRRIARLKIRGLSQQQIADVMNLAQSTVSTELKKIRDIQRDRIVAIDQDVVVGESMSVFEEVRDKAWQLYTAAQGNTVTKSGERILADPGTQVKALSLVLSAQEKQNKLLMELGVLKRAAQEHNHKISTPPFIKAWEDGEVQRKFTDHILASQLSDLEEPEPPEDDIIDAEFEEEIEES